MTTDTISILSEKLNNNFLIVGTEDYPWIPVLEAQAERLYVAKSQEDYQAALSEMRPDIIIYLDASFETNLLDFLEGIPYQAPQAIIAIVSAELTTEIYSQLIKMGVSDAWLPHLDNELVMQRILSLVRQKQIKREMALRSHRLRAVSLISQKLHNAEHPTFMIIEAIELTCSYFNVYGVAITIDQGARLHLYAGTSDVNNRRRLYESSSIMEDDDPLRQVISSGMSLIFPDIRQFQNFTPIPVIHNPKSAIIVPIKHGNQTVGSLAVFSKTTEFNAEDLAIFELLASSFGTAYENITHYYSREMDTLAMRAVLKAWQKLNGVFIKSEIAQVLHDDILGIEAIRSVGIWLFSQINSDAVVYSDLASLNKVLEEGLQTESLQELLKDFDNGLQPITLHKRMVQSGILTAFYDVLESAPITLVPIAGSSFEGLIFVTSHSPQGISQTDMSLIENLAQVTANVLERNTLVESVEDERRKLQEQTGRIEGVLHSIGEGIFFVDDQHEVVYCTPQFGELTNISPSQILNQPFSKLFQLLAAKAPSNEKIFEKLNEASEQMQNLDFEETHAIVEISNPPDTQLRVEFMRVNGDSQQRGWIGVISANEPLLEVPENHPHNTLLQDLLDDVALPLLELNNVTMTLPEQYEMQSPQNFEVILRRLGKSVQDIQSMWSNFGQIYQGETVGIQVLPTLVDPMAFIDNLLTSNRMYLYRRQIRIESKDNLAKILLDERQMRRCFINLIEFMSHVVNQGAPIFVGFAKQGKNFVFNLQEKTTVLHDADFNSIFTFSRDSALSADLRQYRLGMYLARQIVEAHGGKLSIVNNRGMGLTIKLQVPLALEDDFEITSIPKPPMPSDDEQSSYKQSNKGLSMTILESQSRFLTPLYNEIKANGHEIILEKHLDDVMSNLKISKVDIILLEVDRPNTGLVGQVQRIRAQSEVPIVIISLPIYENDCLQGLAHGADDYFTVPFNQDKLLAQLYAISKRQELAARTSEPIIIGELKIDFSRRRVYLKDKLLTLTTKEYDLLRVLVMNRGFVMTHQRLLAKVWGPEYDKETQYLWVNISRLRKKLEPTKDSPNYIQNEPRVGYVFRAE